MKQNTRNALLLTLSVFGAVNCLPALAAGTGKANYVPPNNVPRVSDRLIVKLRPNFLSKGLSVAQINAEMNRPFAAQTISQMQAAAGANLAEIRALSNGAHVLSIPGTPNRQAMDRAIAGIGRLANVEYVEEDRIMTAQVISDPYYTTYTPTGTPGLWGMQPVSAVASPAPGGTGSYGADFETAWVTRTGTGVVVAVVDTGITPHEDIVGVGGTVSPATGNLVSPGYTFISDCRIRGITATGGCAASSPTSPLVPPSADATDTGDYLTAADVATTFFSGLPVSDSSWHGTHVAGTIAAIGNNVPTPIGVIGGAYGAKILPVRVLGKGGGYLSDITDGVTWAAGVHTIPNPNPAKVINLSLGGIGPCSVAEQTTIDAVVNAGAVVVVAAGNENQDVANASPANCRNVISVAAIARDGSRATYSNFSSPAYNTTSPAYVTLAAPGGDQISYPVAFDPGILSTFNLSLTTPDTTPTGSTYHYYQGTSMATPHVSAAVALMLSVPNTPALTPAQVKTILSSPDSLTAFPSFSVFPAWDCATSKNCGAGILNANLAVQNSTTPLTASLTNVDFGTLTTNGTVSRTVTLTNNNAAGLTLGTATITGPNAALFTMATNTCTTALLLGPAGTCQITMNYTPASAGSHSATLSVPTTAPGAIGIGLSGIRGPAALTTATPAVTATTVIVGQSTTVDLSFTNPNAIQVTLGSVTLSQPTIMALSFDTCSNAVLAAGATCLVTVTITPHAVGAYSGTVTASLAGGASPTQATISGTANAAPSGGGGGGCSVMPAGANPDPSLPLALLVVLVYWLRRRVIRTRGAA